MRDKKLNVQHFLDRLITTIDESPIREEELRLRSIVGDDPNFSDNYENSFFKLPRRVNDLIVLSVVSWYIDPIVGSALQLDLAATARRLDRDYKTILEIILFSRPACELYLIETTRWHTNDWWGNMFSETRLKNLMRHINWRKRDKRKPKTVQRKRGHTDGNSKSQTPNPEREYINSWQSCADQGKIEQLRFDQQETLAHALQLLGFEIDEEMF